MQPPLREEVMEDKCPFCGSIKVKEMTVASGKYELFDCHNIFVYGKLYDKRHITCYENQLTSQAALLEKTQGESEGYFAEMVRRGDEVDRLTALLTESERLLRQVPHFLADEAEGLDKEIDAFMVKVKEPNDHHQRNP